MECLRICIRARRIEFATFVCQNVWWNAHAYVRLRFVVLTFTDCVIHPFFVAWGGGKQTWTTTWNSSRCGHDKNAHVRASAKLCVFAHRLVHGNPSARIRNLCVYMHAHVGDCVGFRSAHVHMRVCAVCACNPMFVVFMFAACVGYMIFVLCDGKSWNQPNVCATSLCTCVRICMCVVTCLVCVLISTLGSGHCFFDTPQAIVRIVNNNWRMVPMLLQTRTSYYIVGLASRYMDVSM